MDDIARLQIRIESLEAQVAETRLKKLEDTGGRAERSVEKLGKSSFNTKRVLGALGLAGAAAASALAGGAVLATREWLKYDKAIKEVNSITSQTTAEFKAMRKEVLGVAQDIGVDATQAARGLYQALSAGIPQGQQAIAFLRTASRTAIAGVTSVDTAVDGLTNVLNAFKIPAEQTEEVADKLFNTVRLGKTTFEELSASISKGSVPAAALGVSLDDLLASVVGITKQGTPTAEAFTQIRGVMAALTNPSDELADAFRAMGVESGRALIQQEGFIGALQRVREAFHGQDQELVKALRQIEAYNGLLSLTGDNAEEAAKAQDELAKSSGAMGNAYRKNAETLENALNSLKASAVALVEEMEGSLGLISAFTEALRGAALAIQELSGSTITEATQGAINSTGAQGVNVMEKRLRDLHMLRTQLNQLNMEGEHLVPTTGRLSNFGTNQRSGLEVVQEFQGAFGDVTGMAGTVDILAKVEDEIKLINSQLEKTPEKTKAIAAAAEDVNSLAAQLREGSITQEEFDSRRVARMAELNGTQLEITKQAEAEAAAAQKVKDAEEAQAKAKAAKLQEAKETLAAQEAENKALDEAGKEAMRLATTEEDRLHTKLNLIAAAKEAGRIDQETADKAKANIQEQLALMATRGGGGGGGGAGASFGITPQDLRLGPAITAEEDFQQQIQDLQSQFFEQRNLILSETQITEEERTNLLVQLTEERNKQLGRIEQDRVIFQRELDAQSLSIFESTLGEFNSVFQRAGKEGSTIAKALFVAQKAAAIAGILVNTEAQAALAGAQTGIFGIPLQVLIRAQGAASAGIVAGTTIAGLFEHGGMIPAGQYGIAGEAGPELVRGPAVVTSAASTRDMAAREGGPGQAPNVNVNVVNNVQGVEVETRASDDRKSIDIVVKRATNEVATQIRRGEGPVPAALENTYSNINRG